MDRSVDRASIILLLVLFKAAFQDCVEATVVKTSLGSSVTLPCKSSYDYPAWNGPNDFPYNYAGSAVFNPQLGEKINRLNWKDKIDLVITNVVRNDTGNYRCIAVEMSYQIQLVVRVQPESVQITNALSSTSDGLIVQGNEGSAVNLTCVSSGGYPEQTVHLYRNSTTTQPLTALQNRVVNDTSTNTVTITHVVSITPVASDDNIDFICQSSFTDEPRLTSETTAKLYLNLKPNIPIITQLSFVKDGDNKPIARCTTDGFRPEASFNMTWIYRGTTTYYTGSPVLSNTKYSATMEFQKPVTRADNGQTLICSVGHLTLSSPLSSQLNISVQFAPESVTISGNQKIVASGTNQLLLNCTTSSSNPASDISWKKGPSTLSNISQYTTSPAQFNGVIRSQVLSLYPTRDMDGNAIVCEGSNNVSGTVVRDSVTLDLLFRPVVDIMAPEPVVEGNYSLLVCSASSKPPSTFKWFRQESQQILIQGTGTTGENTLVYNYTYVRRTDAGLYICEAENKVESPDRKTINLTVFYPPDVVVEGHNTTVMSGSMDLTCNASGIPNSNYKYDEWIQEWPGYGIVANRSAGQILKISNLTYEHSGIYKCRASNGIKLFGTNYEYMEGSLYMQVRSFPIRTDLNTSTEDPTKVPGSLGNVAEAVVEYYSLSKLTIKCYKVQNGSRQISSVCWTSEQNTIVRLNVFTKTVSAPGVKINISVSIESQEIFGSYELNVSNDIGSSLLKLNIIAEGPPEAPKDIQVDSIQAVTVMVSWQPGFHGGFDQTVYVQTSKDGISWVNKTSIPLGKNLLRTPATLEGLEGGNIYYLRMFADNQKGRSDFSEIQNFTTMPNDEANGQSHLQAAAIGGGVGSAVVVLAVAAVLIIIWRRRLSNKDHGIRTKLKESSTDVHENNSDDEDVDVVNPMYVSAGPQNKPDDAVYAKANKKSKAETKSSDVYAVVDKPKTAEKKKKTKQKKSQQAAEGDIYENAPKTSGNVNMYGNAAFENTPYESAEISAKPKKSTNADDLTYADLAFSKTQKGRKLVIHGVDDRTPYAQVDFTKHADPLPESDAEEREQTEKK